MRLDGKLEHTILRLELQYINTYIAQHLYILIYFISIYKYWNKMIKLECGCVKYNVRNN